MSEMIIKRGELSAALDVAAPLAEKRNTIPVLANVLLTNTAMVATNLEQGVRIGIRSQGEFRALLSADKLKAFAANLPVGADLKLVKGTNGRVTVSSAGSRITFAVPDADSFPELPNMGGESIGTFAASALRSAIEAAAPAISEEQSRFTLNAALLDVAQGCLVATDGHRLHRATIPKHDGAKCLIPKALLHLIKKLDDEVTLTVDESHVFATAGDVMLLGRRTSGQFPDYERVMPKAYPFEWTTSGEAMVAALRRVMVASDERSRAVKLTLGSGEAEITAATTDIDAGEKIAVSGEAALAISVSGQYLSDACKAAGEKVTIRGKSSDAALVVEGASGFTAAIMPMRM